jgi:membrane-associated phospholipid phosphatase
MRADLGTTDRLDAYVEAARTELASAARRYRSTPLDALVQGANALLLAAVLWTYRTLPHAATYAACHVLLALGLYLLSRRLDPEARPFNLLALLHHWLPAFVITLMFFELGVLIPLLRDYSDLRYDHALQAIDLWLLGDPVAFVERHAAPWLSEVLTVCYFAYYPLALLVPATLYVHGAKVEFQRVATIIVLGFLLSYLGYFAFPALGPHRVFDARRPAALDGVLLSRVAYEWLLAVPHEPPDAFPSGHALIALLVPAVCWRWARVLFYFTVPIALGIVLATVYLRLHYLTDVAAAFVLAPLCYGLGCALTRSSPP